MVSLVAECVMPEMRLFSGSSLNGYRGMKKILVQPIISYPHHFSTLKPETKFWTPKYDPSLDGIIDVYSGEIPKNDE